MNKYCFVDIGNSFIKYKFNCCSLIGDINVNIENPIDELISKIKSHKISKLVVTSGKSSNSRKIKELLILFVKQSNINLHEVVVSNNLLKVNYQNFEQFGVDRYLNLLAARELFKNNFAVVSCGTAITIDMYIKKHIGGIITPGIELSLKSLNNGAGLSNIELPEEILGYNTATSIGAGVYIGKKYLIEGFVQSISKQYNQCLSVIFTGGNADLLALNKDMVYHYLLFDGMNIYCKKENI